MSCSFISSSIKSARFPSSHVRASWPEMALAVENPARFSAFSMRRSRPWSSWTMKMLAVVGSVGIRAYLRHLDQRNKQPQVLNRLGKFVIINRFHDVTAAPQRVATLHLARIIGRGQHDHGHLAQFLVLFKLA